MKHSIIHTGFLATGILFACQALFATGELDNAYLIGTTDKPHAIDYKVGEEMVFTLALREAKPFTNGAYTLTWERTGDDGQSLKGRFPLKSGEPFVYRTSIAKPGFVRLRAKILDDKGTVCKRQLHVDTTTPEGKAAMNRFEKSNPTIFFDGGAGAAVETLQSVPEPADFDAFWARHKARLAKVPMTASRKEVPTKNKNVSVYAVSIMCAGPRPSTGYLTVPKKPGKYPIRVSFHGYGHGYPNRGHVVGPMPYEGALWFNFSPHGYELGREKEYYDEFFRSICSGGRTFGFDEKQNADPENCYFSGYTYRIMRALQWLKSLPEWDGKNLIVAGGSMGGMQSVWAAALDPDVTVAEPSIPWNCDIGGRDTLKRHIDSWYIHETPALRYYDPVNLAKRINPACHLTVTRAGLGDYCCPPSGVCVLWNNLPCHKKINWVQGSTHGYVPPKNMGNQNFTLEAPAR